MAISESANIGIAPQDVLDCMPNLVWVANPHGELIAFNAELEQFLGYCIDDPAFASEGWPGVLHPQDKDAALVQWRHSLTSGDPYECELRVRRHDGLYRWHLVRAVPYRDPADHEIVSWIGTCTDVDESHDNRALLRAITTNVEDGLWVVNPDGTIRYANPAALRMLGYQSFAEIEGKASHATIRHSRSDGSPIPQDESLLSVIVPTGKSVTDVKDLFFRKDGSEIPVQYSAAPAALEGGTGLVIAFRDISGQVSEADRVRRELETLAWVGRIRDALDQQRLVLHAQPIFDIKSRELVHEELLMRMIDTEGGLISPGAFLPTAEKYGLIIELDRWVVHEAVKLCVGGRKVAANLSAHSLSSPGLLQVIKGHIETMNVDAGDVTFEITETALMHDAAAGQDFTERLAAFGCRFSLDDFGTGFNSFTYLKHLPVEYLKIDIEFVRDLPREPDNQHVVRAVVSLADAFGKKTIAEGVEDEETLNVLQELGVDCAQGFHLGRPVPA